MITGYIYHVLVWNVCVLQERMIRVYQYKKHGSQTNVTLMESILATEAMVDEECERVRELYPGIQLVKRYSYISLEGIWDTQIFNTVVLGEDQNADIG